MTVVHEINHVRTTEMKNQMKNDPGSYESDLYNCIRSLKKTLRNSTGFEPMTS